ncbi:MAG: trigger factor [Cellvibrionaceae bacterium]|jgi:trigger factor
MQVSIETTTGLERKLTIAVPAEKLDAKVNEKLVEVAKSASIKGFRKGKVPMKIIDRQFGSSARQEVASDLINSSYLEALEQESLNPAGHPRIEVSTLEAGKDLEYVATIEVYPEVSLSDFSDLTVSRYQCEVSEADIDKGIEHLQEQRASFNEVDRAAADGDQATIDFVGTKEGEAFQGGDASDFKLQLGSNSMIPGFESGIVGMAVGDQKTLSLTFPEDYQAEDLKGADVEFAITLKKVEEKRLPEIDAEFIKHFDVDSLDDFRQAIQTNMGRELKRALLAKTKAGVMEQLLEKHEVDLPQALVASEIDNLREQMTQQFGNMQKNKSMDMKSLLPDDMFREEAQKRVSLGLIVGQVVKNNEITADADRIKEYVNETASSYKDPESVVNYYYQNEKMLSGIESVVLEDKAIEFVIDCAKINEETITYEEAVEKR